MFSPPTIRPEMSSDEPVIAELTREAFRSHPHSSQTESFIIDALRKNHVLSISLVAEVEDQVVGHIAFSPVDISDGSPGWFGLGPLAVAPSFQGQGIGTALVESGISYLQALGAYGCVVNGDPKYYERFGFRPNTELALEGAPQEFFLSFAISENRARGNVTYHESFNAQGSPP